MSSRLQNVALVALVIAAAGAGCDGSDESEEPAPGPAPAPTAGDQPGADRPQVGDGRGGVRLAEVATLDEPVHVTQPPSGDPGHLYVAERCGRVQRLPVDGGEPQPFLDLSDRVGCEGAEQGLLSVAFPPDHNRSGLLYVYYTDTNGDTRVVEYERDGDRADPASARELLEVDQPDTNHNGGLLAFGPDGRLWIGLGDGGGAGDPERTAQDLGSPLGKLLRIEPGGRGGEPYAIPADNPLAEAGGPAPDPAAQASRETLAEIAAYGLRNPWRFSFDREGGRLWIGDVGQDQREEIDTIPLRAVTRAEEPPNFGWSAFEGTARFNADQSAPGAIEPVLEYGRDRGCSVTGGVVVRDPRLRPLYGRYLYGDFCAGQLRSFTAVGAAEGGGDLGGDDRALGPAVEDLSSFGEDARGRVYATSLDGPVYRLDPAGG